MHFKSSDEYISAPNKPTPAHIYVRYDNAFNSLKPRKIKNELIKLAYNPRDAFYLPLTIRMLASWKLPELKELLISFLCDTNIKLQDIDLLEESAESFLSLENIRRELKFTAIDGLKYYPSSETITLIEKLVYDSDSDIRILAKKSLKVLTRGKTGDGSKPLQHKVTVL